MAERRRSATGMSPAMSCGIILRSGYGSGLKPAPAGRLDGLPFGANFYIDRYIKLVALPSTAFYIGRYNYF